MHSIVRVYIHMYGSGIRISVLCAWLRCIYVARTHRMARVHMCGWGVQVQVQRVDERSSTLKIGN